MVCEEKQKAKPNPNHPLFDCTLSSPALVRLHWGVTESIRHPPASPDLVKFYTLKPNTAIVLSNGTAHQGVGGSEEELESGATYWRDTQTACD